MSDLCEQLETITGLDFSISDDTDEPYAYGHFSYWVTSLGEGWKLEAFTTIFHDEIFSDTFQTVGGLGAAIKKLEEMA